MTPTVDFVVCKIIFGHESSQNATLSLKNVASMEESKNMDLWWFVGMQCCNLVFHEIFGGMSQHTLESRAHSCNSLVAGADACARIGGMQLFKGMSRNDLQRKLQVGCFKNM